MVRRKLFKSPEFSIGSENQLSETEKPVTVLSEGSNLLRVEDCEHPSKRRYAGISYLHLYSTVHMVPSTLVTLLQENC